MDKQEPVKSSASELLSHIQEAFSLADVDNKGYLSRFDLKVAMVSLFGYKPSSFEVDDIISKIDMSQCPGVTFDQLQLIASNKLKAQDGDDHIRQIFRACDLECRGFITLDNAKKIFTQAAPFMDAQTVEKGFKEIDGDRDGRVSYKDFEFMMKYIVEDE